MVHNLEKKVKGCFKRRVSITLAMLTIFAITGSVGFANDLKVDYKEDDITKKTLLVSHTDREKVAEAFNKTNKQVNANTKELERLENSLETEISRSIGEDLKHNQQIAENREGLVEERKARKEADEALQAALDAEIERSEAKDKEHDEGIAANKKAIEEEVARSTAKDDEHDKGIAANKEAIETEVERSKAKDKEHDEGIAANKKAIDAEVERSKAEDVKHDKGIADNKKAIEELRRDSEEGIASVAAMSVLDFKGAPVGRVGIGAAIGGYRGKQAVAVGMAFAPSENLNFTGKVGLSTDDIRNSAYGVGVNYFF